MIWQIFFIAEVVKISKILHGYQNVGYQKCRGDENVGYQKCRGDENAGYQNVGYQNVGYQNVGYQNVGYQKSARRGKDHCTAC